MINYKSHVFYFSLFFILFYIESISIAGVKIAILWKMILIAFIVAYIVFDKGRRLKGFMVWGYLYSLKNFFTISSFTFFVSSLAEVIKCAFIPLLSHFFMLLSKNRNIGLLYPLQTLSVYIIVSSVPFLVGLVEPLSRGYDLSLFGVEAYGFIGIFQVAHSAAVTISFAMLILLFSFLRTADKLKKIFFGLLLILGLWIEIQTYARTGFAVLFVAGGYLLLYKKNFIYYLKLIIPIAVLGTGVYVYYLNSPILQMRIGGTNKYLEQSNTQADMGSGRFKFSATAIENWSNSDISAIFIGLGEETAKDLMEKAIGMRIYAHNGFVDILQFNGLIGVLVYLLFLIYLFRYILSHKYSQFYQLNVAMLMAYLTSMFFQGEHFFLADVIFALALALLNMKDQQRD